MYLHVGDMPHIFGKLLTRATTLFKTSPQLKVSTKNYGLQSIKCPYLGNFEIPTWES
jgi:hypothetical protein